MPTRAVAAAEPGESTLPCIRHGPRFHRRLRCWSSEDGPLAPRADSGNKTAATFRFPPTTFPPRYPGPLPILEPQGSSTAVATTPAGLEFARLEAWLASSRTLQLPLHEIESQQQTKGREVQRLLLQAHIECRGDGDVGPALLVPQPAGSVLYTHRRLRTRSLKIIFGRWRLTAWATSAMACPASIHSARPSPRLIYSYGIKYRRNRFMSTLL
jgi:hypothetical protein